MSLLVDVSFCSSSVYLVQRFQFYCCKWELNHPPFHSPVANLVEKKIYLFCHYSGELAMLMPLWECSMMSVFALSNPVVDDRFRDCCNKRANTAWSQGLHSTMQACYLNLSQKVSFWHV